MMGIMASYKYISLLEQNSSGEFDTLYPPEHVTPHSGIYRCEACGFECASKEGYLLPSTRSCDQHDPRWRRGTGNVRWQLVVYAIHTI